MPASTPDDAVDTVWPTPEIPPSTEFPPNEELELTQVVTEPTIMATAESTRSRRPNVTPGASRATEVVDVGCGA